MFLQCGSSYLHPHLFPFYLKSRDFSLCFSNLFFHRLIPFFLYQLLFVFFIFLRKWPNFNLQGSWQRLLPRGLSPSPGAGWRKCWILLQRKRITMGAMTNASLQLLVALPLLLLFQRGPFCWTTKLFNQIISHVYFIQFYSIHTWQSLI